MLELACTRWQRHFHKFARWLLNHRQFEISHGVSTYITGIIKHYTSRPCVFSWRIHSPAHPWTPSINPALCFAHKSTKDQRGKGIYPRSLQQVRWNHSWNLSFLVPVLMSMRALFLFRNYFASVGRLVCKDSYTEFP